MTEQQYYNYYLTVVLQQDQSNSTTGGGYNPPSFPDMPNQNNYDGFWQIYLIVITFISIVCSLFVIFCYFYFKSIQCFSLKLIAMLCVTDIFFAVGHLLVIPFSELTTSSWQCQAQGFLDTFSGLSSVLWTSIISYSLYQVIYKGKEQVQSLFPVYLVVGYGVPMLTAILIKTLYGFGMNENQCWIYQARTSKDENFILEGFSFYFELWICFIINSFLIYKILKFVKENSPLYYNQVRKLILFPLILPFCWLPGTVHIFLDLFGVKYQQWIIILTLSCGYLQGILNAIIFASTEAVSQKLKEKLRSLCITFRKQEDKSIEDLMIEQNIDQLDQTPENEQGYISQKSTFLGESFLQNGNNTNDGTQKMNKKQILTKSDIAFIAE